MTPTRIRAEVEPGGVHRDQVFLMNGSSREIKLRPLVRELRRSDSDISFGLSPQCGWVRVEGDGIVLPPGETRSVGLAVQVPGGEPPGAYSLAVVFAQEGVTGEGMAMNAALALVLELVVLPAPATPHRGSIAFPLFLLALTLLSFPAVVYFLLRIGKRVLTR